MFTFIALISLPHLSSPPLHAVSLPLALFFLSSLPPTPPLPPHIILVILKLKPLSELNPDKKWDSTAGFSHTHLLLLPSQAPLYRPPFAWQSAAGLQRPPSKGRRRSDKWQKTANMSSERRQTEPSIIFLIMTLSIWSFLQTRLFSELEFLFQKAEI